MALYEGYPPGRDVLLDRSRREKLISARPIERASLWSQNPGDICLRTFLVDSRHIESCHRDDGGTTPDAVERKGGPASTERLYPRQLPCRVAWPSKEIGRNQL